MQNCVGHSSSDHTSVAVAHLKTGIFTMKGVVKQAQSFCLNASESCLQEVCERSSHLPDEGQESCYEIRGDGQVVKSSGAPAPENGPKTKKDALIHVDPIFDALRTALFMNPPLEVAVRALQSAWGASRGAVEADQAECERLVVAKHARPIAMNLRGVSPSCPGQELLLQL